MNKKVVKIVIPLIVGFIAFMVIGTNMGNREVETWEQQEMEIWEQQEMETWEQQKQQKEQATAAANAKVESLLNQNDFAGARAAAQSISDSDDRKKAIQRISSGEVGYLISEGDFYMASQIAIENECENIYYEKVVPALIPIYHKYEAKGAIEALSYCVLPREFTEWGTWYPGMLHADRWITFCTTHNNYIERFIEYMKLDGDTNYKKVGIYFMSNYEGGTKDVNAIKAKHGIR